MQQLEIEIKVEDGRYVVIPRGEVDLVTQAQLKEAINELVVGGNVDIIVDLDETTFLDSTGLGALIGARRKTHAFMGSFAIVLHPGADAQQLFRITSLDKVFAIRDSRAEALARPERAEAPASQARRSARRRPCPLSPSLGARPVLAHLGELADPGQGASTVSRTSHPTGWRPATRRRAARTSTRPAIRRTGAATRGPRAPRGACRPAP